MLHKKSYSTTKKKENVLIYGGLAMIAGSVALQYSMKIYNSSQTVSNESDKSDENKDTKSSSNPNEKTSSNPNTGANAADSLINSWFARTFYEGGFEDKMSRRESGINYLIYFLIYLYMHGSINLFVL